MTANREYKDSVFIHYLSQSDDRLVEIYNAVAGTEYPLDTPVDFYSCTEICSIVQWQRTAAGTQYMEIIRFLYGGAGKSSIGVESRSIQYQLQ